MGSSTLVPASPSQPRAPAAPGDSEDRIDILPMPEDVVYVEAAAELDGLMRAILRNYRRMGEHYEAGHFVRARNAADTALAELAGAVEAAQQLRGAFDQAARRNPAGYMRPNRTNGKEAA